VTVAFQLAHRLAVLPEVAMREAVLVEALSELGPAAAVEVLDELSHAATRERGAALMVALSALAGALERLPYGVRRDLYEAAKAGGRTVIARLFFTGPTDEPAADAAERYVPGTGRRLTLGARKALARGGRRELVTALLADPDASVIKNLLENPRLVERDVLAIASRRPVRGEVLRVLFGSRWRARYHVRRALVFNPHTPGDIAVRLVGSLVKSDLRLVSDDGCLSEPVRAQARLALTR
jgi:hypothetical protein